MISTHGLLTCCLNDFLPSNRTSPTLLVPGGQVIVCADYSQATWGLESKQHFWVRKKKNLYIYNKLPGGVLQEVNHLNQLRLCSVAAFSPPSTTQRNPE